MEQTLQPIEHREESRGFDSFNTEAIRTILDAKTHRQPVPHTLHKSISREVIYSQAEKAQDIRLRMDSMVCQRLTDATAYMPELNELGRLASLGQHHDRMNFERRKFEIHMELKSRLLDEELVEQTRLQCQQDIFDAFYKDDPTLALRFANMIEDPVAIEIEPAGVVETVERTQRRRDIGGKVLSSLSLSWLPQGQLQHAGRDV